MAASRRYRIAMIGVRGLASAPPAEFAQGGRLAIGGAELAAEELAKRLAARGHAVTLYARGGQERMIVDGVAVEPSWYWRGRRTEALSHSIWATIRALRDGVDLVHFHAVGPGSCAVLARAAGVPSVVTVQGLDWAREKWHGWEQRLLRGLAMLGIRSAAACTVVAPSLLPPIREVGARSVEFIPNGFTDVGDANPALLDTLDLNSGSYFLCMSRLVPEKNIHLILDAYLRTSVTWPLVIAGGSSDTDAYVAALHARAAGSRRVRFVGIVSGTLKATLLTHAGAFLNASSVEGLSLAIVEAVGQGIPTAISAIPPNLDVFSALPDAPKPFILDTTDVMSMAKVLHELTKLSEQDRADWRHKGSTARKVFSWDDIADRMEALYERMIPARSPSLAVSEV